jgi:hypothetical protein
MTEGFPTTVAEAPPATSEAYYRVAMLTSDIVFEQGGTAPKGPFN